MKTFRYIALSLLVLIILFVLVGLVLPNRYKIEAKAMVQRSPEVAYFHALDFNNRPQWDPWIEEDPRAHTYTKMTENGMGSVWEWDGEKVGKGKITVRSVNIHEQIRSTIHFMGNGTDSARMVWNFNPNAGGTELTWQMKGEWGNFFARWAGLFMKGDIIKSFQKGLNNFKNYIERLPNWPGRTSAIRVKEMPEMRAVVVEKQSSMEEIAKSMGEAYGELMEYLTRNDVIPAGPPFARYTGAYESGQPLRFEAGFPVEQEIPSESNISFKIYPAGRAITAQHTGPYQSLFITYNKVIKHAMEKNLKRKGEFWETYLTDPQTEPDSTLWVTMVYYPIE